MPKSFTSFPKLPEFLSSRFFSCSTLNRELTKSGIQSDEERLPGRGSLIQWHLTPALSPSGCLETMHQDAERERGRRSKGEGTFEHEIFR